MVLVLKIIGVIIFVYGAMACAYSIWLGFQHWAEPEEPIKGSIIQAIFLVIDIAIIAAIIMW